MSEQDNRPAMPKASDYQGTDRARFRAGVAAAKGYYRALQTREVDYCGFIERADARNEAHAWYDGWDSVCNPEYFAGN
jgi:hypothetical protein